MKTFYLFWIAVFALVTQTLGQNTFNNLTVKTNFIFQGGGNAVATYNTLNSAIAAFQSGTTNLTVRTRSRSVLGSGGGADYYFSTTAPGSTNRGTIVAVSGGYLLWDGTGRLTPEMFGAIADDSVDDTAALDDALAFMRASIYRTLFFGSGAYQTTNTVLVDGKLNLVGDVSAIPVTRTTRILFGGTNAPIVQVENSFNSVENMLLMYASNQPSTATASGALTLVGGGNLYWNNFRNLAMRNGAYGVYQAAGDGFQNTFRDIYVGSGSISLFKMLAYGTLMTFDNLYLQNIRQDSTDTPTVNVTSATRSGGVITLTLASVPPLLDLNRFVSVSGITPSGYNGAVVITNITGNQVTYNVASDPGAYTSGGTLSFVAQRCSEAPVQFGFGEYDVRSLDVEHVVTDSANICLFQGSIMEVASLHVEQCYTTNANLHLVNAGYKSPVIGSFQALNLGVKPGQTLTTFYNSFGVDGGRITVGSVSHRDIAYNGATWNLGGKALSTYGNTLVSAITDGYTSRLNATGTPTALGDIEVMFGGQPMLKASSGSEVALAYKVDVNQSGTAGYTGLTVDVTETATGSGTKFLQRWVEDGTTRASINSLGVFRYTIPTGTGSTDFIISSESTDESAIRFQVGAAVNRRMVIGGNYIIGLVNSNGAPANFTLGTAGFSVGFSGSASVTENLTVTGATTLGSLGTSFTFLRHGRATLASGTVGVAETNLNANTRIIAMTALVSGTPGFLYVSGRTNSVGFGITSSSGVLDDSIVDYIILQP